MVQTWYTADLGKSQKWHGFSVFSFHSPRLTCSIIITLTVHLFPLQTQNTSYYKFFPRLIYTLRRFDAPISVHWLRVPERIAFKVAVLTYRVLLSTAPPPYLPSQCSRVTDTPTRVRLRSVTTDQLNVLAIRLSTVGRRTGFSSRRR